MFCLHRAVKFLAALGIVFVFSGCFTLENRRDLYTADFDRTPVHTTTTTTTAVQATTTTRVATPPVTTRKTAPEVKPIPSDPEEANLPPPLPTP